MKLITLILSVLVAVVYAIQWYNDIQVPAWQALIWVLIVVIHDFNDYFENKV